MNHQDVQRWLDQYIAAWRTFDSTEIAALFSADATYRYYPWDNPIRGRDEIARAWVAPDGDESQRDAPDSWDAQYEPFVVEGNRAVAIGWSRYFAKGDEPEKLYHNAYLIEFDGDGRCTNFTEYYVEQK